MWKDIIKEKGKNQVTVEISRWLSRATPDAIGNGRIQISFALFLLPDDMTMNSKLPLGMNLAPWTMLKTNWQRPMMTLCVFYTYFLFDLGGLYFIYLQDRGLWHYFPRKNICTAAIGPPPACHFQNPDISSFERHRSHVSSSSYSYLGSQLHCSSSDSKSSQG
jgi:hypothetical protein